MGIEDVYKRQTFSSFLNLLIKNRIIPAARDRTPIIIKGGIVATANRVARYVEPHIRYMAPKARKILISCFFKISWHDYTSR